MFKGSNVALVTPFKNDKLDDETYIKLIHFHIKNGTNGLVPAGTTGESPTLSHNEHERVIELCVKESAGKLPVFAGTGSNSTEEAISLTKHAEKVGANAALIVTPYYNKPTQEGLYQHYKAINDNCSIPIIIYNICPSLHIERNYSYIYVCLHIPPPAKHNTSQQRNTTTATTRNTHIDICIYYPQDCW